MQPTKRKVDNRNKALTVKKVWCTLEENNTNLLYGGVCHAHLIPKNELTEHQTKQNTASKIRNVEINTINNWKIPMNQSYKNFTSELIFHIKFLLKRRLCLISNFVFVKIHI